MEATPATPAQAAPEAAPDTPPPAEPVETPEVEAPADQPAAEPDRALGQAEYTRSQQAFSALKAELGLDRHASREDVLAAVAALRGQPGGDDTDDEDEPEVDPRVAEANERAFRAELRVSAAIYGQDFTDAALELTNFARTTDDPTELMTAFAAFRDRWGAAAAAATTAAGSTDDASAATDPNAPPAPVGLSEGDPGPSARPPLNASQAKRESGPIGAVRGIFADLGIASRPPSA